VPAFWGAPAHDGILGAAIPGGTATRRLSRRIATQR
jgi:hypothetical protein